MGKKHFWFKFEWDKWRNDPSLRRCNKEAKGFWIDAIAAMEELDTYFLEGTPEDLCRDLVCTMDEFERSIAELKRTGAATISKSQGRVKVVSRKLLKEVNLTEYNRLKQRESRKKRRVKNVSRPISKIELRDKKEEEEIRGASATPTVKDDPVETRIWKDGREMLERSGVRDAGPVLGKMVKDYGKAATAAAIASAQATNAADPKTYIFGILRGKGNVNINVGKYTPPDDPVEEYIPPPLPPCKTCGDPFCLKPHKEEVAAA